MGCEHGHDCPFCTLEDGYGDLELMIEGAKYGANDVLDVYISLPKLTKIGRFGPDSEANLARDIEAAIKVAVDRAHNSRG